MAELSSRLPAAVEAARIAHRGAVRKGTDIPYLSHVLIVSGLVMEHGGDEDQAVAALLHDVAEDAGGEARLGEIARAFGAPVADIVRDCSDSLAADPARKAPWWVRKVRFLDRLARLGERSLLVSAADKAHNVEALLADYRVDGEDVWRRFDPESGRAGQLWYHRRVAEILRARLTGVPARLGGRVGRAVDALDALVGENVGPERVAADAEAARARAAEAARA